MTAQDIDQLMQLAKSGAMSLEQLMQHADALKAHGHATEVIDLYKIWIACTQSDRKSVV